MEDDKNLSASSEDTPNELAENVQQEAELRNETGADAPTTESNEEPTVSETGEDLVTMDQLPDPEPAVEEAAETPNLDTEEYGENPVSEDAEEPTAESAEGDQSVEWITEPSDKAVIPETGNTQESDSAEANDQADEVQVPADDTESSIQESTEQEEVKEPEEVASEVGAVEDSTEDESDQEEEEEDNDGNEFADVDLENATKAELLDWARKISKEENFRKIDRVYKDLGSRFEEIYSEERNNALEQFLAEEGNGEGDFEYHEEEVDKKFREFYETLRHRRSHFFHQLEKEREENLASKTQILDALREAVDGEDQTSFNTVKKLQEEWKKIGPVPGAQNKQLWANYHALMDRFYDQRTIYFELKDLDRKKNLEAKIELCEKAEALAEEKNLMSAIVQLNELHEEYKHIGPVPKEDQEPTWQRFKAASDHIYVLRKEYTDQQKEIYKKNLAVKEELALKAQELTLFDSDRIKEWNQKTKELLALQKKWEGCGGIPREQARAVNKEFWGSFKKFYANKSKFFKGLDAIRTENLNKKKELVAKALELRESTDFEKTANDFKNLQNDWREIGPVPDRFRKSIYEEFKSHCDYFFDRRRGQNAEQNQEFVKNLEKKMRLLDQLEEVASGDKIDMDLAYSLTEEFSEVGLVPRNSVGKTLDRYDKIGKKITSSGQLSDLELSEFRMHLDVCKLKNSPNSDQKMFRKENTVRRKIQGLENDINNWRTNMDYFADTKGAEKFKKDFAEKIEQAEQELEMLKNQLRQLH